jgi:hypothetical protein
LNDGYALVVVTSILFGAYHWWTGIGNIVEAVLIGVLLMLFYRRSAALWPIVLAHYLTRAQFGSERNSHRRLRAARFRTIQVCPKDGTSVRGKLAQPQGEEPPCPI